jgi:hypothetical protein
LVIEVGAFEKFAIIQNSDQSMDFQPSLFYPSFFGLSPAPLRMLLKKRIVAESTTSTSLKVNPKDRQSDKFNFRIFTHVTGFSRKQNYNMKEKTSGSTLLDII